MSHAPVSPSALSRHLACPGARAAELPYPDVSGAAAIDGTGSHELLEECLGGKMNAFRDPLDYFFIRPETLIGRAVGKGNEDKPQGWVIKQDRADRVLMAIIYVESRIKQLMLKGYRQGEIQVASEFKSNPGKQFGRNDWYGTADIVIAWPDGLEIADYKDGRGYVDVNDNPQLTSYLGGLMPKNWYEPDKQCRMTIIQPKTNNPIRFVNLNGEEAITALEKIHEGVVRGDSPNAERIPGDHCKWCKHKPNCVEHAAQSTEGLKTMNEILKVDEVLGLPVTELTGDQISQLLAVKEAIESRFKEICTEADSRAKDNPEAIPGYAMTPGNGVRKYNKPEADIQAALKKLKMPMDQYLDTTLKSVAQLEKQDYMKKAPKRWASFQKNHVSVVAGSDKLKPVAKAKTYKDAKSIFDEVPTVEKEPEPQIEYPVITSFL